MTATSAEHPRTPIAWRVLVVLLTLEILVLTGTLVWLVMLLARTAGAGGINVQSVSLVIVTALALAWVITNCVGAIRSRVSWVRGSALTIHVLWIATGTGCLQLQIGEWWFGTALIAVGAIGVVAAILTRPEASEHSTSPAI